MNWPEKPTCHGDMSSMRSFGMFEPHWESARSDPGNVEAGRFYDDRPFRFCSHCGSMHPEDLLEALTTKGATLGGSDWKYGWPHKFYVENLPTGLPGIPAVTSSSGRGNGPTTYGTSIQTHAFAKWYNEHLKDEGYSEDAFAALLAALKAHTNIHFERDKDGELKYRAPYQGYQR